MARKSKATKSKRPSVWQRAKVRMHGYKLEKLPSRFLHHRCATTGQRWVSEWKQLEDGALFSRVSILEIRPAVLHGNASGGTQDSETDSGRFAYQEFDWVEEPCRGCGDMRLVMHCPCGELVCGGRSEFAPGQRPLFVCDQSCGRMMCAGPAPKNIAGQSGSSHNADLTLARCEIKRLPKPPKLLPRK